MTLLTHGFSVLGNGARVCPCLPPHPHPARPQGVGQEGQDSQGSGSRLLGTAAWSEAGTGRRGQMGPKRQERASPQRGSRSAGLEGAWDSPSVSVQLPHSHSLLSLVGSHPLHLLPTLLFPRSLPDPAVCWDQLPVCMPPLAQPLALCQIETGATPYLAPSPTLVLSRDPSPSILGRHHF